MFSVVQLLFLLEMEFLSWAERILIVMSAVSIATACQTLDDCHRAGVCVAGKCSCDPGWTGESCQRLDLIAQEFPSSGAAWNTRNSSNSSWCITVPRTEKDYLGYSPVYQSNNDTFHIFVSQMVPGCSLETWIPGSRIIHATSDNGILGPYVWKEQVAWTLMTCPHYLLLCSTRPTQLKTTSLKCLSFWNFIWGWVFFFFFFKQQHSQQCQPRTLKVATKQFT